MSIDRPISEVWTTPCVQDLALDRLTQILRLLPELVTFVGSEDRIQRSTSFEAMAQVSPPFVLVGALNESEDFSVSKKTAIEFSAGVMLLFEDYEDFHTLGTSSFLTIVQEIKRWLMAKPHHVLQRTSGDSVVAHNLKSFEVVQYDSARREEGVVDVALLIRVVYTLWLEIDTRESLVS